MGTCQAPECSRTRNTRSYCLMHYQRWRRTGTVDLPDRNIQFNVPPLILAYLAGAVDADGTIGMNRRASRGPYYTPRISLAQVHDAVPRLLLDTFGGRIDLVDPPSRRNVRPQYVWDVRGARAVGVATILEPLLIIKRRQAQQLIGWGVASPNRHLSVEERARRAAVVERLHELNRTGRREASVA